jgi:hypothetical protein
VNVQTRAKGESARLDRASHLGGTSFINQFSSLLFCGWGGWVPESGGFIRSHKVKVSLFSLHLTKNSSEDLAGLSGTACSWHPSSELFDFPGFPRILEPFAKCGNLAEFELDFVVFLYIFSVNGTNSGT